VTPVYVLSGGAAQGLVRQLEPRLQADLAIEVHGTFGAVGTMKDLLLAGQRCDVLVLTQALIDQLVAAGRVVAGSARRVGVVRTGIAVRDGDPDPDVTTPDTLRTTLLAARGIYFPDPIKATAGIHVMKVLTQLGIATHVSTRLRSFPNGATAMRALADADGPGLIGCTQVTEILATPGARLAALLPKAFELATTYTAAVAATTQISREAHALVHAITGGDAAEARRTCGFE
jgi:molybdate transport system substrate-binding protein